MKVNLTETCTLVLLGVWRNKYYILPIVAIICDGNFVLSLWFTHQQTRHPCRYSLKHHSQAITTNQQHKCLFGYELFFFCC